MARLNLTAEDAGQKLVLAYLEENASDSLAERINAGSKTMSGCWSYIRSRARSIAKNNCACVEDSEVYNWAIHYFEEDNLKNEPAQAPAKKEDKQTISFAEIKAIQKEKERKAQQEALDRINEAKRKEEQLRKEKQKEEERKRKAAGGIDGQLILFDLIGGE